MEIDTDEFRKAMADSLVDLTKEYLETEARENHFECDCGSTTFDIEAWEDTAGDIQAAGVCRECNERLEIDVDMSDINALR
jgi:hypothetical protein